MQCSVLLTMPPFCQQVVRRSASLESDRVGDVTRGKVLLVVDEDLVDGVIRCHLGKDSSPRGVAVHNVGWVTAAKDGELKLTPIKEEGPGIPGPNVKVPEPTTKDDGKPDGTIIEMPWSLRLRSKLMEANIDPSFTRLNMPSTPVGEGQESMASRIASMRLEKQRRHQRATASAPAPAASEPEPDAKETTKEVPVEAKFVWATSAELNKQMNHIESSTDAMEKNAHAKFDTVEAQLGRLLNERKIKLEDLMKEWDRNRDGDISKQEFRLHVKKLGLDADTGQIDALYDSLDLDGSGSLDTDEMKEALRKMQEDVRNVKDSVNRVLEHVANMRKVIVLFQTAANNTLVVEAARFRLDAMRAAVKEDSAASRIANTLTAQDLKLTDLDIGGWEADGKKFASAAAFSRAFEELEAEVTPEEIAAFFETLDFSSNDILDVEEVAKLLYSGGAKTTAAKQQSRKAEEAQVKNISSVKSIAEASQKTARASLLHAEGVAAEKEAEIKEATAAKAASMQTSKVEEQKQKGKRKGTTVAKFMAS